MSNKFEKFVEEQTIMDEQMEKVPIKIESYYYSTETLQEELENIDTMSASRLYNVMKSSYKLFLNEVFNNKNQYYIYLLTNEKFLNVFIEVMAYVTDLDKDIIMNINKIAYDYTILSDRNENIKNLLFSLSRIINRSVIPKLVGLGLSENYASYLALARYSSKDEILNIRRLNYIIMSGDTEVITCQMIVRIYEKLFDDFVDLFKGVMFDTMMYSNVPLNAPEIYNRISYSITGMLNNLPSNLINKVLKEYIISYYNNFPRYSYRFSLKIIPVNFDRVLKVLNDIKQETDICIP